MIPDRRSTKGLHLRFADNKNREKDNSSKAAGRNKDLTTKKGRKGKRTVIRDNCFSEEKRAKTNRDSEDNDINNAESKIGVSNLGEGTSNLGEVISTPPQDGGNLCDSNTTCVQFLQELNKNLMKVLECKKSTMEQEETDIVHSIYTWDSK